MWVLSINSRDFNEDLLSLYCVSSSPDIDPPLGTHALVIWNRASPGHTAPRRPPVCLVGCPPPPRAPHSPAPHAGSRQPQTRALSLSAGVCAGAGTPRRAPTGGHARCDLCRPPLPLHCTPARPHLGSSSVGSSCGHPAGSPGPLPNPSHSQVSHTPPPGQPPAPEAPRELNPRTTLLSPATRNPPSTSTSQPQRRRGAAWPCSGSR